jgi:hypothetical protein
VAGDGMSNATPDVIVEVGFAVGAAVGTYMIADDLTRGLADVATAAPDTVWTDVTAYVQSFTTKRGASRVSGPILRYEAGTFSVTLDNSDRRFDPANTAGPYVSGGVTQVTPMRAARILAVWAGVTYEVIRGFVDSWEIDYTLPNYSSAVMQCTDAFKVLTSYDRTAGGSVGAGEDTGARVSRILDSAGWPSADRVINTGSSTLQATTLDGDVLSELQLAQDSELGELYVDAGGRVVFRSRHALLEDSRSVISQVTFGDGGGTERAYSDVVVEYDDTQLVNLVQVSRVGGAVQVVQDADSQAAYLIRSFNRSDLLLQTDTDVAAWAGFLLFQSKDPEFRLAELVVNPRRDPDNLYPQVLGLAIGDRITVVVRPPGGGAAISRDVFVRGMAHTFAPAKWSTTLTLQSATKYSFMVADDPILGLSDVNAAGY